MPAIIDLSHPIQEGMPVYPGDDPVSLRPSRFLIGDYYNDHRLTANMHAGTHIDGPMHLTDSPLFISDLEVGSFWGPGCLLDVRGQTEIGVKPEYLELIPEKSILLLFTGFDLYYGRPEYYNDHPVVNNDLCQLLINKRIKLLGVDLPSPDKAPFPVHKLLFAHGVCVAENLTNLDRIPLKTPFEVFALPLKIRANSSPARVIARI
jgi:kynurenine formamidase